MTVLTDSSMRPKMIKHTVIGRGSAPTSVQLGKGAVSGQSKPKLHHIDSNLVHMIATDLDNNRLKKNVGVRGSAGGV